jgi:hypothetical protein
VTDPAIIEAAARAMCRDTKIPEARWHVFIGPVDPILAAVTPLIEAAALEKAAKFVEGWERYEFEDCGNIAAAIRALIAKDSGGGD